MAELITRYEAEFSGRLLYGPADWTRWQDDPEGLCWGMLGVAGCDSLIRGPDDLDRVPGLFARGVRVFQALSAPDDETGRGLGHLGRAFLQTLSDLGSQHGPRPLLDLAGLGSQAVAEVLDWLEADPDRARRVIPVHSRGPLDSEALGRLRALEGVVGLSVAGADHTDPALLREEIEVAAAIPFGMRTGYEGIAISTGFLDTDVVSPDLSSAARVAAWLEATFPAGAAALLIHGNARALVGRALLPAEMAADRAALPDAAGGDRGPVPDRSS